MPRSNHFRGWHFSWNYGSAIEAILTGLEPATFSVTGRRANQSAPQDRDYLQNVVRTGIEPVFSEVKAR